MVIAMLCKCRSMRNKDPPFEENFKTFISYLLSYVDFQKGLKR